MMWVRGSLLFPLLTIQFVSSRLINFGKSKDKDTDEPVPSFNVSDYCLGDDSINFSNWNIETLPSNAIESKLIKAVNLDNNNLRKIPYSLFDGLPNIECLNLARNRISVKDLSKDPNISSLETLNTLILDSQVGWSPYDNDNDNYGYRYRYGYEFSDYNRVKVDFSFNVSYPRLTTLRLTNNSISIIDVRLPKTLQHLYLERNQIVHFVLFDSDNLQSLYLDYNSKLNTIVVDSPNIEVASFKGCSLLWSKLNNFFERDRFALRVLDLSNNSFSEVRSILFQRAKNLEILILNNNEITQIPKLQDLPRLRSLLLSHNLIRSVRDVRLDSLTMFSLRDNYITKIDETTFQGLPALETLDLSENELKYLPKGWTDGLNQLKTLNLTSNWFTSLGHIGLTPDFSDLTDLYLEENLIANITDQELYSVPANSTIHLFRTLHRNNEEINLLGTEIE